MRWSKADRRRTLPRKPGLANLVASLLDEGTTSRTSKQLAEQIDFVGGALEVKAAEDFTTASARVLKKDVELGFTLLADILQHPAFHKPEFERIRSQIVGEMASDNDDPGHVAMKAFNQLVFHGHPYRWPLNGTEESLNKITHAGRRGILRAGIRSKSDDSHDRGRRDGGTGRRHSCRRISEAWKKACTAATNAEDTGADREERPCSSLRKI